MIKTFRHKFPGGYRCEFDISFAGTEMRWSPANPPQSWPHWRSYRRWRDRCLKDFAIRTGVALVATLDLPWAGMRGFTAIYRDGAAAYAHARAERDSLANARELIESAPGMRAELLTQLEAVMLRHAPRSAGGAA